MSRCIIAVILCVCLILPFGASQAAAYHGKILSYSAEDVYVDRIISKQRADGTWHSWIVVHAVNGTMVNHLTLVSSNAKDISVERSKNWVMVDTPFYVDCHADGNTIIKLIGSKRGHGLVVRVDTDVQPVFRVKGAMHH